MDVVYSKVLKNGLTVVFTPHNVDSTTICLRGFAGSNFERKKETGIAHFLEHLLMAGSTKYPGKELKNLVLNLGGRVTGTTSREDVAFLTKLLNENIETGLIYLSNLFFYPEFSEIEAESCKSVIYHEIKQNIENPQRHIGRIAYKILFPKDRFANFNTGTIEDVEAITVSKALKFYKRNYLTSRFVLSICGNYDSEGLFDLVETYFSGGKRKVRGKKLRYKPNHKWDYQVEIRKDMRNFHLKIDYHGFSTFERKKYASYLFSKILLEELRKNLKIYKFKVPYILDVSSFSSNTYGLFGLYTAISKEFLQEFLQLYFFSLKNLSSKHISVLYLENVKRKIHSDFIFTLEKTSLRADFYSELYLYDNFSEDHITELDSFLSCNREDIRKMAEHYLSLNPKFTVIADDVSNKYMENAINKSFVTV